MTFSDLPALNAALNGLSATCLVLGRRAIRQGRPAVHRRWMLSAFACSTLFLGSYLVYHIGKHYIEGTGVTRFAGPGWLRPVYLAILGTHSLLAAVVVPLVLVTLYLGLQSRFETHRRLARWTWPIWMYVSVTGVMIYLMLYHVRGGF